MDRTEGEVRTQRPPAYAELLIDSLDRYPKGFPTQVAPKTSSSSWSLNFQQNVLYGFFTRLAITQIQFQWNLPTIIAGYNDQIRFNTTAGGNQVVTLTPGFQDPETLAANLEDVLQTAFPTDGFTVSFISGTLVINATNPFTMPPPLITETALQRCLITLGLSNSTFLTPSVLTLRGGVPTMLPTRFVDICSSYMTKYQRVKDQTTLADGTTTNVIARVYPVAPNTRIDITTTTGPGINPFNICIDYNTPKMIKWSPDEAFSNFDLQLRDDFGELLPWTPEIGCEYQLTMLASET